MTGHKCAINKSSLEFLDMCSIIFVVLGIKRIMADQTFEINSGDLNCKHVR